MIGAGRLSLPFLLLLAPMGAASGELVLNGDSLGVLERIGASAHPTVKAVSSERGPALSFSEGGIECLMNATLSAAGGSVDLLFQIPDDWPASGDRTLFHIGEEAHVHVSLFFRNGSLMAVYKGGQEHYASIPFNAARSWRRQSWHRLEFSWQAEGNDVCFFLRVDGQLAGMANGRLIAQWPQRFFLGERGPGRLPWQGLILEARFAPQPIPLPEAQPGQWTVNVRADNPLGECYNFWSISNFTSQDMFTQPEMREIIRQRQPFMKYVNCVRLLGGRTDGKNEWFKGADADGRPICDFAPMIACLRGILDWGYTPRIVLDNVPTAMSDPPQMNTYGNTYAPKDYNLYHHYIEAAVRAMVDAFGFAAVSRWRFRVMTEPDLLPGHWAGTEEEYLKLYDFAVDAVTRVIPEADIGPGNILDPSGKEDPNVAQKSPRWGLEIVDHAATGKNHFTGKVGTRLRFLSCSYYGRVGRAVETFDTAIHAMRERLDRYVQYRELPVEVAEFSVLADERGRRFQGGEATEWAASWFAAIADRVYRLNVAQIHQWNTTAANLLTPMGLVIERLEGMAGGQRLTVDVDGPTSAGQCGAIACRKDGRLLILAYAHRANRRPNVTDHLTIRIQDSRMTKGRDWKISEWAIDESHGVFLRELYADCEAAGVEPLPDAPPPFGADVSRRFGPPGAELFRKNAAKYEALTKAGQLRAEEPLAVGDGQTVLELDMPTHSVRFFDIAPSTK